MSKIGVLASGRGSNFQAIIDKIDSGGLKASMELLVTDNPSAFAIERARKHNIPHLVLSPRDFEDKDRYYGKIAEELKAKGVELVILAGFMRVVGKPLLDAFPMQVMNIHPALLPSFPGLDGQGQAVTYGVKMSGLTVHFVDEGVDTGPVIMQAAVPVLPEDTEESLSERILSYEHKVFPEAIRLFTEGRLQVEGRVVRIKGYDSAGEAVISPPIGI